MLKCLNRVLVMLKLFLVFLKLIGLILCGMVEELILFFLSFCLK